MILGMHQEITNFYVSILFPKYCLIIFDIRSAVCLSIELSSIYELRQSEPPLSRHELSIDYFTKIVCPVCLSLCKGCSASLISFIFMERWILLD